MRTPWVVMGLIFGIVFLMGGLNLVTAETHVDVPGIEPLGNPVVLTPNGGEGYYYFALPDGTRSSYSIFAPGSYILGAGFSTENESAIKITGSGVTLDGNYSTVDARFGLISIESGAVGTTVKNFVGICGWRGITSNGDWATIINNNISDSMVSGTGTGITSNGVHAFISRNTILNFNGDGYGLYSTGDYGNIDNNNFSHNYFNILNRGNYTTIINNTVSFGMSGSGRGMGIDTFADYVSLKGNIANNNGGHGIQVMGNNTNIESNVAFNNKYSGIVNFGPNATIINNIAYNNSISEYPNGGISPGSMINVTVSGNHVYNNNGGILNAPQGDMRNNIIENNTGDGIYCSNLVKLVVINNTIRNNTGYGVNIGSVGMWFQGMDFYNNYLSNDNNICNSESRTNYTNPAGPQPGTNIMGGPYIAGNYWSNPNGTGWSDLEPGNPNGYTTTPYEVAPGANDTAPLVRIINNPVVTSITPSSANNTASVSITNLSGSGFFTGAGVNLTRTGAVIWHAEPRRVIGVTRNELVEMKVREGLIRDPAEFLTTTYGE